MNINNDTPELRKRIDSVIKECVDLHIPPPPVTWINIKVEDDKGNIVNDRTEKANSWVRNFYNSMALFLGLPAITTGSYGEGSLRFKTTAGSEVNVPALGTALPPRGASVGDVTAGIVVGTGTGAESFESYNLESLIENGTSAGQLSYQAGSVNTPSYNSELKKWTQTIVRIMNNNTAETITVAEVGIIAYSSGSRLIERSLLSEAVNVPPANKITVTYTIEMTFPA